MGFKAFMSKFMRVAVSTGIEAAANTADKGKPVTAGNVAVEAAKVISKEIKETEKK